LHTVADIASGLILVALATTLVGHKETKNVISATSHGFSEGLLASQGVTGGKSAF
jgi:hypothetical protein